MAKQRFQLQLKEGWTSLVLLLGMTLSVGWALIAAGWTDGLAVLQSVAIISVIAGLAIGKSSFPPVVAHVFSAVYGAFWIGYASGPLLAADNWHDRIIELAMRLATWLGRAVGGGQSRDPLMFVIIMGAMLWILGYMAAWYTYRWRREWQAILPVGIALLLINYYYYGPAKLYLYLILFLLCALLFIVHMHFVRRSEEWRSARVGFSPDLWYGFLRSGVLVAAAMLLIAWAAPPASANSSIAGFINRAGGPWRTVSETWQRMFSAIKSYGQASSDAYGRMLTLGGPVELSDIPIMDVAAPRLDDSRYYWRAMTYDEYNGVSWQNTDEELQFFNPRDPDLVVPDFDGRREITQTLMTFLPTSSLLYSAPQPLWMDREAALQYNKTPGGLANISSMRARDPLRQGDIYTVISSVTVATENALRNSGDNYPDWVSNRYLQLPGSVTERTRELARSLAAPYDNAYDKTIAIQNWLRDNITYNLKVDAPPDGRDAVDWILFESREGYCNYYASAMIVMLRSLGIPARFSAGYAQGEWNQEFSVFRVRERDAHAWPEVFFPKYGWVEFEPTVSQDPIDRPVGSDDGETGDTNQPDDTVDGAVPQNLGQRNRDLLEDNLPEDANDVAGGVLGAPETRTRVGLSLFALLMVGAAGAVVFWSTEIRGLKGMSIVSRSYARLLRYARWLGISMGPHQTPYERAEAMTQVVPQGREPITRIADLYVQERFGRGNASPEADTLWRRLRPQLILGGLRRAFARLQERNLPDRWIRLRDR
jgi:hypothetical protein